MKRIFGEFTYGPGPSKGCWWDETCAISERQKLKGSRRYDVAVIGAGITGISAALHMAQSGLAVCVLEEKTIGWGASARNGGFCCLGGGMVADSTLDRRFGIDGRREWRAAEKTAVNLVGQLIETHGIAVDRHSDGETELAHRPMDMARLQEKVRRIETNYGVIPQLVARQDLAENGLAGPFYGAMTIPIGFGLNPRKYVAGLAEAAEVAGADIFEHSQLQSLHAFSGKWRAVSGSADVIADQVIFATNGYSSEDLPDWLAGRYLPAQSNVLVTRPLTPGELASSGWSSDQMAYDTRNLLHYFRLMPDKRFLFGMRGGVLSSAAAEARARARTRRHFSRMFPAWAHVETPNSWSGLVCLSRRQLPFVGAIPRHPGLWAGLCFHGNGVAMGTYSGKLLAQLVQSRTSTNVPIAIREPLQKIPLGRARRMLMPAIYFGLAVADL